MTLTVTPFLRTALTVDALVSGAAGILMIAGAGPLAPLLDLPRELLFWAGIALVPFVAMLVIVARRPAVPRLVVIDIVAINALWVAASFGLLASGAVAPNALGVAFVAAQAIAVAALGAWQALALRQARTA